MRAITENNIRRAITDLTELLEPQAPDATMDATIRWAQLGAIAGLVEAARDEARRELEALRRKGIKVEYKEKK